MASKLFISAKEIAKELEVSDSYAYRLIRQLNAELEQKGFVVVKGKISLFHFAEPVIIRVSLKLMLCTIIFDRQTRFVALLNDSSPVFYTDLCCGKFGVHN